jgi:hypothetical protein
MTRRCCTGAVLLLAASAASASVRQNAAPAAIETPQLTIVVSSAQGVAAPGTRVSLHVDVSPKPRMHVYAPAQKDYIPVSLTVDRSPEYTVHAPQFPAAEKFLFKPLNETQLVYSKPFRIVQDVTLARTPAVRARARTPDGAMAVTGTLRYQACDESVCYAPKNVPVRWVLSLKAARE